MAATYDPTLGSNLDWVRFLTGDTVTTTARLTDEEIDGILAEEAANGASGPSLKYFAAARALDSTLARNAGDANNDGLARKVVEDLELQWGVNGQAGEIIKGKIREYRQRGAFLLASRTKVVMVS
jgi:hypothetical protein